MTDDRSLNDIIHDLIDDSRNLYQFLNHPDTPIQFLASVDETKIQATQCVRRLFDDWNKLHNILLQYEDVIRKRWIKKSQEQRRKVLLTAWPNMAPKHRPDFRAFWQEEHNQRRTNTRFRNEYLYPYINLEDLLNAKNLLLLFHSRGHNKPDVFAAFDQRTHQVGRKSSAIQPALLDGYTMLFSGETSPETYGRMVSWKEDEDAFNLMWFGVGVQPGDGLLLLEIQEKLLHFLVECAELILHDLLPLNALASQQTSPSLLAFRIPSDAEWPSVTAAVAEAPYRIPVQFDFLRLQRLINAKRAEAEDRIWSLREDPGYFQEVVNDRSEHRQEILLSSDGKHHPNFETPQYWNRMFRYVVQHAYQTLTMWDCAQKELAKLFALRESHSCIAPNVLLPTDYREALCHFSYLVKQMRQIPLSDFTMGIFASPPLRDFYVREPHPDPRVIKFTRRNSNRVRPDEYFLSLIEHFISENNIKAFGLYNLLDELERVTRKNSNATGRPQNEYISKWVASALSDLAVVSELERQVEWHHPRAMNMRREVLEAEFQRQTKIMAIFERIEAELYDVGMPLMRFKYPSEKRRTAATTEKMREAEKDLDLFWHTVDSYYEQKTGKPLIQLMSSLTSPRELERTSEWVEPETQATSQGMVSPDFITNHFSTLDIGESIEGGDIHVPIKVKIKTRGSATIPALAHDPEPPAVALIPPSTIAVTKRALQIFSALFYDPTQALPPGEIPWSDFVHALSSAGFGVEKQHGSAWLFTPSEATQRSIIFHEPHPASKIPIHIARRHGRRLTRAYGWTSETFVTRR